jgi:excinuclease ABC subunit B
MYADAITPSMERAIAETKRRREIQRAYNEEHGITPTTINKAIREVIQADRIMDGKTAYNVSPDAMDETRPAEDLLATIQELEVEMKKASKALEFEQAAHLRDEINRLKRLMPDAEFAESVAPSRPTYMAKRSERAGRKRR